MSDRAQSLSVQSKRKAKLLAQQVLWLVLGLLLSLSGLAANAPTQVSQAELTAYKDLQQSKLDALKETQQKEAEIWKAKAEALDKRIDDQLSQVSRSVDQFGIVAGLLGLLVTLGVALAGFFAYKSTKAEAAKEAKTAAISYLNEKLEELRIMKKVHEESMEKLRMSEQLKNEVVEQHQVAGQLLKSTIELNERFFLGFLKIAKDNFQNISLSKMLLQNLLVVSNANFAQQNGSGKMAVYRAYVNWLLGHAHEANVQLKASLHAEISGGQAAYTTAMKLTETVPISEDQGFRDLMESFWSEYRACDDEVT